MDRKADRERRSALRKLWPADQPHCRSESEFHNTRQARQNEHRAQDWVRMGTRKENRAARRLWHLLRPASLQSCVIGLAKRVGLPVCHRRALKRLPATSIQSQRRTQPCYRLRLACAKQQRTNALRLHHSRHDLTESRSSPDPLIFFRFAASTRGKLAV